MLNQEPSGGCKDALQLLIEHSWERGERLDMQVTVPKRTATKLSLWLSKRTSWGPKGLSGAQLLRVGALLDPTDVIPKIDFGSEVGKEVAAQLGRSQGSKAKSDFRWEEKKNQGFNSEVSPGESDLLCLPTVSALSDFLCAFLLLL